MTYRYYTSPAAQQKDSSKPALVLHHGFPDSAHLWGRMVPKLSKLPNRLLIPDLLGYGGTSKPTDPKAYAYHLMAQDMREILDAEGIDKIITIGHDHGVGAASRFYNHFPHRTAAMVLLNVAYRPPVKNQSFNLDAINAQTKQIFGYPTMEYWNFFTEDDAADVIDADLNRFWTFAHPAKFEGMRDAMCIPGRPREMMMADQVDFETKPHAKDEQLKATWMQGLKEGGMRAPLQWYHAITTNVQSESDQRVPDENIKVNVPFLYIGCDEDAVCRVEMIQPAKEAGLLPDFSMEVLKGVGHWPMYERPEDTAGILMKFIAEKGI